MSVKLNFFVFLLIQPNQSQGNIKLCNMRALSSLAGNRCKLFNIKDDIVRILKVLHASIQEQGVQGGEVKLSLVSTQLSCVRLPTASTTPTVIKAVKAGIVICFQDSYSSRLVLKSKINFLGEYIFPTNKVT